MQPYSSSIDTVGGSALRNASVAVKLNGELATIYALDGTPQDNPMTTDEGGRFAFRAANGEYTLEISRVGIVPRTETVYLYDPADDASSTAALAAEGGAALVGHGTETVAGALNALQLSKAHVFGSVDDMLAASVAQGMVVQCGGYNSIGDGGSATFEVVSAAEAIGIPSAGGTLKFKRIEGHDALRKMLNGITPAIAAHRGYAGITSGEAVGSAVQDVYFTPENTIYSIRKAAEHGAWAVECDAKWLADDTLAVFHDSTVDRTTNGTGNVTSFTLAELKALDAGSYVSPRYADARVMDFDEWFAACRRNGVVPMAELSTGMSWDAADAFVTAMTKHYPDGHGVLVFGTMTSTLQMIRDRNANCAIGAMAGYGVVPSDALFDFAYRVGNGFIAFTGGVLTTNPEVMTKAKDMGLPTAYAIANTPSRYDLCVSLGVDIIVTDVLPGRKA